MGEKQLQLGPEVQRLRLGDSFNKNGQIAFHTVRYDFKPASVDTTKVATVDIGENNQLTVTVPHIEGSGTTQTVFKGPGRPYQKECVLIIDHTTGEIVLERLNKNITLKKTRAEGSSKYQRPHTPVELNSSSRKPSPPPPKSSHSPLQRTSPHHTSPGQQISPPSFSQKSPGTQRSPTMPGLVPPPPHVKTNTFANPSMPILVNNDNDDEMLEPLPVGLLSDSSSDSSSSSSSDSGSESSDSEGGPDKEAVKTTAPIKESSQINGASSVSQRHPPNSYTNRMPPPPPSGFSQLRQDLHLSESESDSD